jgi:hypothetical protein
MIFYNFTRLRKNKDAKQEIQGILADINEMAKRSTREK